MKYILPILSALASTALANPLIRKNKSLGTTPRRLEDDFSWMTGYTLKYENCFSNDGLVSFRLCPQGDECRSGCSGGGQYLVDLNFFIDAFTEAQMEARDYACEMVRENCDGGDEDQCYQDAGLNYCANDNNNDEFNLQEYLECKEYDENYYVGPYCSSDDAYSIYLGLFTDQYCTVAAEEGTFNQLYGYDLPYSSSSIIENECANCREHALDQDQAQGDQDDDDDVLEQCEQLYGEASKCEDEIDVNNPDTSACGEIDQLYEDEPAIQEGARSGAKKSNGDGLATLEILAIVAASLLVCCGFYGCYYHWKNRKTAETHPAKASLL